jgi:hypothetical protein
MCFDDISVHSNLFVSCLFNEAASSSDYIVLNDRMINELENMWKEAVVA